MVEVVHWAVRVVALFWSALFTGYTPVPAPPPPNAQVGQASPASPAQLRACAQDSDCVPMEWVCGDWWAVNQTQQDAARRHVNAVARTRACAAESPTGPPQVACIEHTCVVRPHTSP